MGLTDPLETVLSLLSDATTGLGSTGYEITQDDDSTDCEVLITYSLAKEKLASLFGGGQDYDVIVTLKAGEAVTEYIGLDTTVQKTPIIIAVNVIEKHSATGSSKKYITPELVRAKAKEAILAFVKANRSSPGGSINIWKAIDDRPEEDLTVRPIVYRYVITTETWCYR